MTQEEKAKAYDEAIKLAKDSYSYPSYPGFIRADVVFPELKKSEDDETREAILELVKQSSAILSKQNQNNMIVWLEKRDTKNIVEAWKSMRLEVYQQVSGNRHEPNCSDDTTKMFSLNDIDEIVEKLNEQKSIDKVEPKFNIGDEIKTANEEPLTITKIDEKGYCSEDLFICSFDDADKWKLVKQKPADKVDPKFHVGDWVVFIATESVYQVEKIENSEYTLRHILGGSLCLSFSNEELIREWTIQDAKAGDVLAGRYGTFIFKGEGYCGILSDNTFIISTGNNEWTECLHPATKEQRDTLEKEMADAEYTFDFEKKELKKIW